MTAEDALEELKKVHQKLMSLKWPDMSFLTIIPYELMATIKDCEPLNTEYIRRVNKCLLSLPNAEKPLQRNSSFAFGVLHLFNMDEEARSRSIVDEASYRVHQQNWNVVCGGLVAFLEHSAALAGSKKILRGRPPLAKFVPAKGDELYDHILCDEKTADIKRNSYMSSLCRIMLAKAVRLHYEREWQELYEELYGSGTEKQWRHIDKIVRRIACVTKVAGFGPVLGYSGGRRGTVERLM